MRTKTTAAINAAIDVVSAGGGGKVLLDEGSYLTQGTPARMKDNVQLEGVGSGASWIEKSDSDSIVLDVSGSHPDDVTLETRTRCRVRGVGLYGGNDPGLTEPLMRCYYSAAHYFDDLFCAGNYGIGVDGIEFWDSQFSPSCRFQDIGGTDGTKPAVLLRSTSGAASGMGHSADNCNRITFAPGVTWESFRDGALWVRKNGGSSNPNRINLIAPKMESAFLRGTFIDLETVQGVLIAGGFLFPGDFDAGYSTPIDVITGVNCQAVTIRDTQVEWGNATTVRTALNYAGGGFANKLDQFWIFANGQNPTVGGFDFPNGASGWQVNASGFGNWQGASIPPLFPSGVPSNVGPPPPIVFAGPITDAVVEGSPYWQSARDGMTAYDSTNNEWYVRSGGTWRSVALA